MGFTNIGVLSPQSTGLDPTSCTDSMFNSAGPKDRTIYSRQSREFILKQNLTISVLPATNCETPTTCEPRLG